MRSSQAARRSTCVHAQFDERLERVAPEPGEEAVDLREDRHDRHGELHDRVADHDRHCASMTTSVTAWPAMHGRSPRCRRRSNPIKAASCGIETTGRAGRARRARRARARRSPSSGRAGARGARARGAGRRRARAPLSCGRACHLREPLERRAPGLHRLIDVGSRRPAREHVFKRPEAADHVADDGRCRAVPPGWNSALSFTDTIFGVRSSGIRTPNPSVCRRGSTRGRGRDSA